jgi:hypothetical protein
MSDADDIESLKAQKEILLEKLVKAQDDNIRDNPWVRSMAKIEKKKKDKLKKQEDNKPFDAMWGVIAAFVLIIVVAGLVNRYVEWAFGIGIGN